MTKPSAKPSKPTKPKPRTVVVYGLDEDNKPRVGRFVDVDPDLVAKAAAAADLESYVVTFKALKQIAAILPDGRLDPTGQVVVPYIEMALYRKLFDLLATRDETKAGLRKPTTAVIPAGLPETWDEIAAGHLVIAQESLEYGWREAIVLERHGETLKLRFRDFPSLPKFTRHATAVALLPTAPAEGSASQSGP